MHVYLYDEVISIVLGVFLLVCPFVVKGNGRKSTDVDVNDLSMIKQGLELVILSGNHRLPSNYQFEDFFWTGADDEESDSKTINITSKTFRSSTEPSIPFNQNLSCIPTCEDTVTQKQTVYEENENNVDYEFWLITVLESDGKNPVLSELKESLEKLYKTAFNRHQKQHLGIQFDRNRRSTQNDELINVHIHNISKIISDGSERIKVLYHVSVSGKPVIAYTAAEDMKLVSTNEIVEELGFAPIIKAEPYLKTAQAKYLEKSRNTWLFIGAALSILFVLLLLATLITMSVSKRKKSGLGSSNRKQIFEQGNEGETNKTFVVLESDESGVITESKRLSPTYINFRDEATLTKTFRSTGSMTSRPNSVTNSTSSSETSLYISPPIDFHKKQSKQIGKVNIPRPKGALNRTAPYDDRQQSVISDSDSTSDFSTRNSFDTVLAGGAESGVLSAKSYLSMPSVKSFPKIDVPDSLHKVLQPVSVLHLDLMDDNYDEDDAKISPKIINRHSFSAMEDPGVIGPIVWELHNKRLQENIHQDSSDGKNSSAIRKRFHDLLDETFSLFGSRRGSLVNLKKSPVLEEKSKSATSILCSQNRNEEYTKPRPKTSYNQSSRSEVTKPKGAWNSHTPSPLTRPVSAGILKKPRLPQVDVDQVLADGILKPDDPAIALIASIKKELKKCSLPGSITNIAE